MKQRQKGTNHGNALSSLIEDGAAQVATKPTLYSTGLMLSRVVSRPKNFSSLLQSLNLPGLITVLFLDKNPNGRFKCSVCLKVFIYAINKSWRDVKEI